MAKKDGTLGKKERRIYSRLIAKQLEAAGVQDRITEKKIGHKKFVDPTKIGTDGKPVVVFEGDVIQLQNPHRNILKKVRRFPKPLVEAFLNGLKKQQAAK